MASSTGGGDRVSTQGLKRIAHILPFPSVGGTEHATLRIAKAVDDHRFTSIGFCLPHAVPVREFISDSGIPCATYEPPVPSYRHGASYLRSSRALARELLRHQVDIVHCSDLQAAHQAGLAGRLAGLPVLCHIRNRFEQISRRDRSFLWPVRKFVFVSRNTWRHFAYDVSPRRGTVVYDGIDVPADGNEPLDYVSVRHEFGIPQNAPIIGMMARVAPQKDFATLARAAAQILKLQPDARFLIAGDYASEKNQRHYREVQGVVRDCGVAEAFIFTGYRHDVSRLINALDVFVLSTHCEGLPLVILEAMARGKPVVATAVDGIPEIVHDKDNGLLFPHEDHVMLATHISGLLKDRAWGRRLGEAGRHLVRSTFSSAQFAEAMNVVYESLLSPKDRAFAMPVQSVPAHRGSA